MLLNRAKKIPVTTRNKPKELPVSYVQNTTFDPTLEQQTNSGASLKRQTLPTTSSHFQGDSDANKTTDITEQAVPRKVKQNEAGIEGLKRYNLSLPGELYTDLQVIADKEHSTVLVVIRKFLQLGLTLSKLLADSDAQLIVRQGERERELLIF